ncbi:Uncharacterised protein g8745 [Pycnogonum litorale]
MKNDINDAIIRSKFVVALQILNSKSYKIRLNRTGRQVCHWPNIIISNSELRKKDRTRWIGHTFKKTRIITRRALERNRKHRKLVRRSISMADRKHSKCNNNVEMRRNYS